MVRRATTVLFFIILRAFVPAAQAQDAAEILAGIRERYDDLRDLELAFTQETAFAGSRVERRTTGTLLLKKQDKYRVESEDRILVTDGVTIWSYTSATRQVLIDHFRADARMWTPERFLTGAGGDYAASLLGKGRVNATDVVGVKLTPRDEAPALRSLKLWAEPGDWLIRRAEVEDLNGVTTVYTVTRLRVNPGINDARFSYAIPEGADVVDLR
jgi:outer membrane lipoprotein carrier protein